MVGESFRTSILSLATDGASNDVVRNNVESALADPSVRRDLSGPLGIEVANACTSSGSQEAIGRILTTAIIVEDNNGPVRDGLARSICHLVLQTASKGSTSHSHSLINNISALLSHHVTSYPHQLDSLVETFKSIADARITDENYGCYIPALLLIRDLRSGFTVPGSPSRQDFMDLFGRRFLAMGGAAKPACDWQVRLAAPILQTLTAADMDGPMNRPLKFKLMQDAAATVETLSALVLVLERSGSVNIIDKHWEGATNIVGACVRLLATGEDIGIVVGFFLDVMRVHPDKVSVLLARLTRELEGNHPDKSSLYYCIEEMGKAWNPRALSVKIDKDHLVDDVMNALLYAQESERRATGGSGDGFQGVTNALDAWSPHRATDVPLHTPSIELTSPSDDPIRHPSGLNLMEDDVLAKARARGPVPPPPAHRPGVVASHNQGPDGPSYMKKTMERQPLVNATHHNHRHKIEQKKADAKLNEDGLAVAVPVSQEDTPAYDTVVAEEWADAPPLYQNRKFISCASGCFMIVMVLATISGIYGTKKAVEVVRDSPAPTAPPTEPPTSERDAMGLREKIFAVSPGAEMRGSVRNQAMHWLVNFDLKELDEDDPGLIQRYVLALHYFSTGGYDWKECSWDPYEEECTYQEQGVVKRTITEKRFLSNAHECDWYGVVCNQQKMVREILHQGNNLAGTIPSEISLLPYLRRFWVNGNRIGGTIPPELGKTLHMADLQLHGNAMTGTIPDEIFDLVSLQRLSLGLNGFTGTIPSRFGELLDLKGLFLFGNRLSGTIPPQIGNLRHLAFVWVHNNTLSGPIPTTFGKLRYLKTLALSFNTLTGSIPTELGNLQDLEVAIMEENRFSGSLPDELFDMSRLKRLILSSNSFSGTLSEKIGQLRKLNALILRNNKFTGPLPEAIGNLTHAEYLHFHYNDFTGVVPEGVCKLKNDAFSLYSDCLDEFGTQLIECECCTDCCDSMQKICKQV